MITLPTRDNVAVLFLDLQEGLLDYVHTQPVPKLRSRANALARLAALHKLPVWLSATGHGREFITEITEPLGNPQARMRHSTTAFSDQGWVAEMKASGRKVLALAGCASELIVQHTALDAINAGYVVNVLVDACGGISPRTEDAAWRRITACGGFTSSVSALCAELVDQSELAMPTIEIMVSTLAP